MANTPFLLLSGENRLRFVKVEDILASGDSRRRGRPPLGRIVHPEHFTAKPRFRCARCPSNFSYLRGLQQHVKYACYQRPRFQCPYCQHRSKYRYATYNHVRQMHKGQDVYCVDVQTAE
jgi:hypothetical protein